MKRHPFDLWLDESYEQIKHMEVEDIARRAWDAAQRPSLPKGVRIVFTDTPSSQEFLPIEVLGGERATDTLHIEPKAQPCVVVPRKTCAEEAEKLAWPCPVCGAVQPSQCERNG